MDELPQDLRDLYARYGMAAEMAQILEVEAGNLALAYLTIFVDPDKVTPEETAVFRAVIDDLNRKTLGAMFRHLKKLAQIDQAILTVLEKALERRNYLAHHFFRTHNFAIHGKDGRVAMAKELDAIVVDLRRGHQFLSAMTDLLNKVAGHGVDPSTVATTFAERGKRIDL